MPREKNERSFVLIAIESEDESFFLERALRLSARFHVIGSVRNAEETVAYLSGEGAYADRQLWPFPNVLLMDFNDAAGASKVAEWRRGQANSELKGVDLSGSAIKGEIQRIKSPGAEAFSPNTTQHVELLQLVSRLEELLLGAGPL